MESLWFLGIYTLSMIALGYGIGAWSKEKELGKKILSRENILDCFKDVDWTVNTFSTSVNGTLLEAKDGTKHFYKVHSIDLAIEKLNVLLNQNTN